MELICYPPQPKLLSRVMIEEEERTHQRVRRWGKVWSGVTFVSGVFLMVPSTVLPTLLARVLADRCHMADVKFGPQMTTSSMVKKPFFIIFYLQLQNWLSVKFYTEADRREGKLSHEEDCSWILLGGWVVLVGGLVGYGQRGKIITGGGLLLNSGNNNCAIIVQ